MGLEQFVRFSKQVVPLKNFSKVQTYLWRTAYSNSPHKRTWRKRLQYVVFLIYLVLNWSKNSTEALNLQFLLCSFFLYSSATLHSIWNRAFLVVYKGVETLGDRFITRCLRDILQTYKSNMTNIKNIPLNILYHQSINSLALNPFKIKQHVS